MRLKAQRRRVTGRHFLGSVTFSVFACLLLVGCADVDFHAPDWDWDGDFGRVRNTDYSAQSTFRYDLATAETFTLTGVAGTVEIVGTAEALGITVEGVRRVRSHSTADAREHLVHLDVEVRESGGGVSVETHQPSVRRGRTYEVEYRVEVPPGTDVGVRHAAGSVAVGSVVGNVEVDAGAGDLVLLDLVGNVRASVGAGDVEAAAAIPFGGVVELRTGAGDITLTVPAETSATLRAMTGSGAVWLVDLAVVDEDPRASVVQATLASGDGAIRLDTGVGDITVRAR